MHTYFRTALVASLALSFTSAIPLEKRKEQTIADSTTAWVAACTKAGGAGRCNTISQTAFTTLLAARQNCDQQNAADSMIDLAKQLNNDPDMIRLAQIFAQQPRNAVNTLPLNIPIAPQPDGPQVPYCQTAPKNTELNGLFHCQFASSDFTRFSGDQTGNLPLGIAAVNPPGSCPAKTDGPVPDGVQLNTLVQSPGTPAAGGGNATTSASADGTGADASTTAAGTATDTDANSASTATATDTDADSASTATATDTDTYSASTATVTDTDANSASTATATDTDANSASTATATDTDADPASTATADASAGSGGVNNAPGSGSSSISFTAQNGASAQSLNTKFAGLSAGSTCTDGEQACLGAGGAFAQCVGGKFESTACGTGTGCFALPLVNKAGTSITCTTRADATARIAVTGATGGISG